MPRGRGPWGKTARKTEEKREKDEKLFWERALEEAKRKASARAVEDALEEEEILLKVAKGQTADRNLAVLPTVRNPSVYLADNGEETKKAQEPTMIFSDKRAMVLGMFLKNPEAISSTIETGDDPDPIVELLTRSSFGTFEDDFNESLNTYGHDYVSSGVVKAIIRRDIELVNSIACWDDSLCEHFLFTDSRCFGALYKMGRAQTPELIAAAIISTIRGNKVTVVNNVLKKVPNATELLEHDEFLALIIQRGGGEWLILHLEEKELAARVRKNETLLLNSMPTHETRARYGRRTSLLNSPAEHIVTSIADPSLLRNEQFMLRALHSCIYVYKYLDLDVQKRPAILHSTLTNCGEKEIEWLVRYSTEISKQLEAINPYAEDSIVFKQAIKMLSELNASGYLVISLADFCAEIEKGLEASRRLSTRHIESESQESLLPLRGNDLSVEYEKYKEKLKKKVADEFNQEILEYIARKREKKNI